MAAYLKIPSLYITHSGCLLTDVARLRRTTTISCLVVIANCPTCFHWRINKVHQEPLKLDIGLGMAVGSFAPAGLISEAAAQPNRCGVARSLDLNENSGLRENSTKIPGLREKGQLSLVASRVIVEASCVRHVHMDEAPRSVHVKNGMDAS